MAKSDRNRARGGKIPAQKIEMTAVDPRLPLWFHHEWFWGAVLLLAVLLAYQPVWYAGFVWDDDVILTANPVVLDPGGWKAIWTTSAADICPLTKTTFWLEHEFWGLPPLPYHLVNVLMHAASAILLWRVLRNLRVPGAWLGAALWALHPVQVESVAWVSEMKNTESGLFFLLSVLFFMRWLRAQGSGQTGSSWNYALTLLFAALAMASKTSTVFLPGVLCLCAWWIEGRWHWRNLARIAPVVLLSVAACALSIWTQGQQTVNAVHTDAQLGRTWPERLATAGDAVWFYLGKLLWPDPLITIYPRWEIDAAQGWSYLPLLAVIVVLFILWLKRESWSRPGFFVFAYFLGALLPVLGLVDNYIFRYSLVFDHFQYLASMGPLLLVGAGWARLADSPLTKARSPWLPAVLGAGVLLILGMLTWQRAWVYESPVTLWTDTLAKNPDCWMAHNNLGSALAQSGQVDEGLARFQNALKINPNDARAHSNLGIMLFQKGQPDAAMTEFQKAIVLDPKLGEAHYNLGLVLFKQGRIPESILQFQEAVRLNPSDANAQRYLAQAQAEASAPH